MTRGELEAAIWQAMHEHWVTVHRPVPFVDAVLRAADGYADAGLDTRQRRALTAQRRKVLEQAGTWAVARIVHLGNHGRHACRLRNTGGLPYLTTDPAQVTCARCKHTRAYAMAGAAS